MFQDWRRNLLPKPDPSNPIKTELSKSSKNLTNAILTSIKKSARINPALGEVAKVIKAEEESRSIAEKEERIEWLRFVRWLMGTRNYPDLDKMAGGIGVDVGTDFDPKTDYPWGEGDGDHHCPHSVAVNFVNQFTGTRDKMREKLIQLKSMGPGNDMKELLMYYQFFVQNKDKDNDPWDLITSDDLFYFMDPHDDDNPPPHSGLPPGNVYPEVVEQMMAAAATKKHDELQNAAAIQKQTDREISYITEAIKYARSDEEREVLEDMLRREKEEPQAREERDARRLELESEKENLKERVRRGEAPPALIDAYNERLEKIESELNLLGYRPMIVEESPKVDTTELDKEIRILTELVKSARGNREIDALNELLQHRKEITGDASREQQLANEIEIFDKSGSQDPHSVARNALKIQELKNLREKYKRVQPPDVKMPQSDTPIEEEIDNDMQELEQMMSEDIEEEPVEIEEIEMGVKTDSEEESEPIVEVDEKEEVKVETDSLKETIEDLKFGLETREENIVQLKNTNSEITEERNRLKDENEELRSKLSDALATHKKKKEAQMEESEKRLDSIKEKYTDDIKQMAYEKEWAEMENEKLRKQLLDLESQLEEAKDVGEMSGVEDTRVEEVFEEMSEDEEDVIRAQEEERAQKRVDMVIETAVEELRQVAKERDLIKEDNELLREEVYNLERELEREREHSKMEVEEEPRVPLTDLQKLQSEKQNLEEDLKRAEKALLEKKPDPELQKQYENLKNEHRATTNKLRAKIQSTRRERERAEKLEQEAKKAISLAGEIAAEKRGVESQLIELKARISAQDASIQRMLEAPDTNLGPGDRQALVAIEKEKEEIREEMDIDIGPSPRSRPGTGRRAPLKWSPSKTKRKPLRKGKPSELAAKQMANLAHYEEIQKRQMAIINAAGKREAVEPPLSPSKLKKTRKQ